MRLAVPYLVNTPFTILGADETLAVSMSSTASLDSPLRKGMLTPSCRARLHTTPAYQTQSVLQHHTSPACIEGMGVPSCRHCREYYVGLTRSSWVSEHIMANMAGLYWTL